MTRFDISSQSLQALFNERLLEVKVHVLSLELIHVKNLACISDKDLAALESGKQ